MAVSLKRQPEALYESGGKVQSGRVVETRGDQSLIQKEDGKFVIRRDEEVTQFEA